LSHFFSSIFLFFTLFFKFAPIYGTEVHTLEFSFFDSPGELGVPLGDCILQFGFTIEDPVSDISFWLHVPPSLGIINDGLTSFQDLVFYHQRGESGMTKTKMDTNAAFQIGRENALDALEKMGKHFDDNEHAKDGVAGLLVTVFSCIYALAPTKQDGDTLIALAKQFALEEME